MAHRVTQDSLEVFAGGGSPTARITQDSLEAFVAGGTSTARASQVSLEVFRTNAVPTGQLDVHLGGLADGSAVQTAEVSNATALELGSRIVVRVKTGASGTSSTGYVEVYAFGTTDGGATRTEGASSTAGAITLTNPPNARLIGVVFVAANATTYVGGPFEVSEAFCGVMPEYWGLIVVNRTGAALDGFDDSHAIHYDLWHQQYGGGSITQA